MCAESCGASQPTQLEEGPRTGALEAKRRHARCPVRAGTTYSGLEAWQAGGGPRTGPEAVHWKRSEKDPESRKSNPNLTNPRWSISWILLQALARLVQPCRSRNERFITSYRLVEQSAC